ncbi:dTDP-4-amino-4,6-dideoxy-D-galactose acyltransferase [Glaesserella sp.]|uniref:dTDP-4-amino-4,6-dideoxy-D-galactose acyltransferase n=1 Tax=Glaesserella sp. TaxID=2094731 RepID=UPI00359FA727
MKIVITKNQWESDFFDRTIGQLDFVESNQLSDLGALIAPFDLVQAKVPATALAQRDYLQQHGFHCVDVEVRFQLNFAKYLQNPTACCVANVSDIPQLEALFGHAFPHSRFRSPWFSSLDNQRFYQTWIRNAVLGQFDDICFVWKDTQGSIQGGISVRLNDDSANIGLLTVSPEYQRQGVAKQLIQAAIYWTAQQKMTRFDVVTQLSNLSAIRLYQSLDMKMVSASYWFYYLNRSNS